MYKEYRDLTMNGAVEQMYSEMAGRHRVRQPCISIIKAQVVPAALTKRANIKQFHDSKIKFPLTRKVVRYVRHHCLCIHPLLPIRPVCDCTAIFHDPSMDIVDICEHLKLAFCGCPSGPPPPPLQVRAHACATPDTSLTCVPDFSRTSQQEPCLFPNVIGWGKAASGCTAMVMP